LNPLELVRQARDSTRMADLNTLNKALSIYQSSGQTNLGVANTVYVSIPKNVAADCSDLGLPALPSGWTYACVASSTLQKIDGTGWIPLTFSAVSYGTPLEKLPVDPINSTSTRNYYTYVMGGSWQLAASFESVKYKMGGSADKTSKDGGSYPGLYEEGTNLTLLPIDYGDSSLVGYWKFDEGGTNSTSTDSSGMGNNGAWSGTGTHYTAGKVGQYTGQFNGTDDYVSIGDKDNLSFPNNIFTIIFWMKASDTTSLIGILGKRGSPWEYSIYTNSPPAISCVAWNSGGGNVYANIGTNYDTLWNLYAYVGDGAIAQLYKNGISLISTPKIAGNNMSNTSVPFEIGRGMAAGATNYMKGFIDDVRIYNRALSATEVTAIYNSTK
ncbi:MAG: LamG domain-containing protein, partial [Candidatus Wolfebacteria bacterium]|nr:LamG domain-containing protein [Candidatus Wolfebacteria bacterium]